MIEAPPDARWIGSSHPFDLQEAYIRFRCSFELTTLPYSALLSLTADSRYKLWVNGALVAHGPRRCYPDGQSVDELDIAAALRPGSNLIAVLVYQPGYSHFAYVHRAMAGLLGWLCIDEEIVIQTDSSWRVSRDQSYSPAVPRVSIYGSGVEDKDLRKDDPWQLPGFNDQEWSAARVVGPSTGYPWTSLEARGIPLLIEARLPATLIAARVSSASNAPVYTAEHVTGFEFHEALAQGWSSAVGHRLPSTNMTIDDKAVWLQLDQASGETSYWVFDLGRDYLCRAHVSVRGASGGETLLVSYLETLKENEPLFSDPSTYCRMRPTDRFTLRAGEQQVDPFTFRGGRYLLFAVHGSTQAQVQFSCLSASYPLHQSRHLTAVDPVLQDVIELCETTFHACLHDGFVDSVWRESSQWVGDALPQALIMQSMSDDVQPLRQAVRMAGQGAYSDGVLPGVAPGEVHAYTVVDYNFSWVELLSLYLEITSDVAFVQEHWPVLVDMLARFDQDIAQDKLIRSQPGRRLFLDWAPVSRQEPNAIYNLRYLLALSKAGDMAEQLGLPEAAAGWRRQADNLGSAIRRVFWRNGRWVDDPAGTTHSQLAAALAALTGLSTGEELPALLDRLVSRSLDLDDAPQPGEIVLASPFMHHYLFEALRLHGRHADVVKIIRRRWGRWTAAGWPTAWENWNVDFPDGSLCHAFSAHPRYHLWQIARTVEGAGLSAVETAAG